MSKKDTTADRVGNIREEIAHLAVPIDQVTPYPGNAKLGDHDTIRESLRAYGQYKALLVQESTGYLVAGNNTLAVMKEEGWTHVAVQRLDLDDTTARKILLMDNKSGEKGGYDPQALVELLEGLPDVDLSGTGYVTDELDELLKATDTLGDAATEFLNPMLDGPPPPAGPPASPTPAAAGTGPAPVPAATTGLPAAAPDTGPAFVQITWACTPDEREVIKAAIKAAQAARQAAEGGDPPPQVKALVDVCHHYLQARGATA